MARWVSAAATDESTPPLKAQITRSLPTCSRICSHRRIHIGLHRPGRLAAANVVHEITKQSSSPPAYERLRDETGGNTSGACDRRASWPQSANWLVWAIDRNPGGIRSIRSPCDIQTTVDPPVPIPVKRSLASSIVSSARPYSRCLDFATSPPERCVTKLHAITDAEDRNALLEKFFGNARRLLLIHTGGTAGQDDALRAIGEHRRQGHGTGKNLRIDLRFANASGDQLGVLRSEIQDQDSIVPEFHEISFQAVSCERSTA